MRLSLKPHTPEKLFQQALIISFAPIVPSNSSLHRNVNKQTLTPNLKGLG
jgi:hypothetical protein